MSTATIKPTPIARRAIEDFPDFDLAKLLGTVFDPIQGCRDRTHDRTAPRRPTDGAAT